MIVLFLLTFAAINIQENYGLQTKKVMKKTIRSTIGKYLRGHVYKVTSQAANPQHCMADCWQENDRCQSFNYIVDLDMCELNEASNITNPQDLIDRPDVVYLTNPVYGREKIPLMPRYPVDSTSVEDPCESNPCQNNGICSLDEKLGFRCLNCSAGFYGQMCEERLDPCKSSPCNGGICRGNSTDVWCICAFPTKGRLCNEARLDYQFDFNGTNEYPKLRVDMRLAGFSIPIWFKTKNTTNYFMSFKPDVDTNKNVFSVWRNGTDFFIEPLRGDIYKFSFPHSGPLDDNRWHLFVIVITNGWMKTSLDGADRNDIIIINLHHYFTGQLRLGYYEDHDGTAYHFQGSLGVIDALDQDLSASFVWYSAVQECAPGNAGRWGNRIWDEMHLATPLRACASRDVKLRNKAKGFGSTTNLRWLEWSVSPPRPLTAFTLTFIHLYSSPPCSNSPAQIACYGEDGASCVLSVVIQMNGTLEIIIMSTRVEVDFIPLSDDREHRVTITWTNLGGVLEVIVDDVLLSRVLNVENATTISGQSRFLVGGNDVTLKNYLGKMGRLNVWDKENILKIFVVNEGNATKRCEVLPLKYLYKMTTQTAGDRGNVVSWDEHNNTFPSLITDTSVEMRLTYVGANDPFVTFYARSASYLLFQGTRCCPNTARLTLTMWLKLAELPAILFSTEKPLSSDKVALTIDSNGTLSFLLNNASISLWTYNASGLLNEWHFIAVVWDSGKLESYKDGIYKLHSTTFQFAHTVLIRNWLIGSRNSSLVGSVTGANVWFRALNPAEVRTLSRGAYNVLSFLNWPNWDSFSRNRAGDVKQFTRSNMYLPYYGLQLTLDDFCQENAKDAKSCNGRFHARIGLLKGRKYGCFCATDLSHDSNFNFGPGNYTASEILGDLANPYN